MIVPADFLAAMASAGIVCTEPHKIAATGDLCRFHVEGDRRGSRNGWAVLHGNGRAAGAFGHWSSGTQGTWAAGGSHRYDAAEAERLRELIASARKQRDADRLTEHEAAAHRAAAIWDNASEADPGHPYLRRKGVFGHGIRQQGIALLIPLRDAHGALWSVETILPDGSKRFLRGGRKAGCFHAIGAIRERAAIAEGYASAASIFEAAGWPTVCAFDAGNLPAVAAAVRGLYPAADLVIFADNDPTGIAKGREAAVRARARFTVARLIGELVHNGH